jgi:hypothetical protein
MQTLKSVVTGLCSMALVLTPVAAPLAGVVAEEPWEIVPEDSLRDLRGGMDLGDLVASFAIQRVVEIDGVVVARMQLVISNLDRLANGGMPTISVTGPMAEIVRFMQTAGNVSVAGSNASIPASVASLPAAQSAVAASGAAAGAAASAAASTGPTVASTGNSGTVSATGTQSGSMAQMGSALTQAVTAAGNATAQTSGASAAASPSTASSVPSTASNVPNSASSAANSASSLANTTSSAANAPAIAASNTHLQASATPAVSAQPVSTSAVPANTTRTIPVGTTGQVVVLSNLPNAAALTTAVQNEVHAATIQTQTTISATINSMPALNAISLSNSIRAGMGGGG